ncbi:MAG TPA: universal stress protein [Clostridia bacterium]|nr:universal stress protein [Clostridia bacterium]
MSFMMNRLRVLKPPPESRSLILPNPFDKEPGLGIETSPKTLPDLSLRRILVPFGFSDTSALLLRRLVPLAQKTGAVLHLLHVVDDSASDDSHPAENSHGSVDELADAAQSVLNLWRDRIVRGRVPAFASVRIGNRADEILGRAKRRKADLIVMTTGGNCATSGSYYPSSAEMVTRNAPCPALIIPARTVRELSAEFDGFPTSSWKTILVPVDFSACSGRVLRYATALSAENGAKLVLLNVMLEGAGIADDVGSNGEEDFRGLERRGKRRLKEWVKRQMVLLPEFESVIWTGIPSAFAVPLEAKLSNADLIVLPVRKARRPGPHSRRSLTDVILRSASCPILSIHEQVP